MGQKSWGRCHGPPSDLPHKGPSSQPGSTARLPLCHSQAAPRDEAPPSWQHDLLSGPYPGPHHSLWHRRNNGNPHRAKTLPVASPCVKSSSRILCCRGSLLLLAQAFRTLAVLVASGAGTLAAKRLGYYATVKWQNRACPPPPSTSSPVAQTDPKPQVTPGPA